MNIKLRFENIALAIVIIAGIVVSIIQILFNRSLWLDESYLALNIIDRDFLTLLQPLDYNQVAPIFFLYIEKTVVFLFGYSEYALRLFPLLCYWASIYFLYNILRLLKLNIYAIILTLSLFLFNGTIIYYSSEVKQYMTDVLVISYLIYFTLKNYSRLAYRYYILGSLGVLSIFLSNVSPIILFCCGIYLFYDKMKYGWNELKYLFITFFTWITSFAVYFLFFIHNHPTREFMINYWSNVGAFAPQNPFTIEFYTFIIKKYCGFYFDLFQFGIVGFYGLQLLFLLGCYNLIDRKRSDIFLFSILPLVVHFILSSLKLYPFDIRLILYICFAFIITLSYGFEFIIDSVKYKKDIILPICYLFLICIFLNNTSTKLPIKRSEVKDCLLYLKKNIKDEKIYFSYYSTFPLNYYKKTSLVDFSKNSTLYGKLDDHDGIMEEIDTMKGRVWFVFSDYIEYYLKYRMMEEFNDGKHRLIKEFHTNGASVLLYEINAE